MDRQIEGDAVRYCDRKIISGSGHWSDHQPSLNAMEVKA